MRWAITHRPQDLPRSKYTLAEGKTLERVMTLSTDDFIGVYAKPESCEETIDCLSGLQNQWIIRTWFIDKRNSANACEDDRVLECEIH